MECEEHYPTADLQSQPFPAAVSTEVLKTVVSIYNSQSRREYTETFAYWLDKLDAYYHPSFLACDAAVQKGEFEIFTVQKNNDIFIYPYIKLGFDKYPYHFDITSPYGYAGPFCSSPELFSEAESAFAEYISKSGCVSEFVRYHYLYNKHLFFSRNIQNIHNRDIVIVNLLKGQPAIWDQEFSPTNRNLIRKLKKEGYSLIVDEDTSHLDQFIDLYQLTMKNANATDFYFFPRSFYFDLFSELGSKVSIARVVKERHTYAAALFFNSGNILTYFLSARDLANYKIPASNLLLSEMIDHAVAQNLRLVNLGGGLSRAEDDSLFKFKRNFSRETTGFYIGKRIYNMTMYKHLQEDYISCHGQEAYENRKHILQFYR